MADWRQGQSCLFAIDDQVLPPGIAKPFETGSQLRPVPSGAEQGETRTGFASSTPQGSTAAMTACEATLDTGGAEGDRTPDLVIANDALSQLSYGPSSVAGSGPVRRARLLAKHLCAAKGNRADDFPPSCNRASY